MREEELGGQSGRIVGVGGYIEHVAGDSAPYIVLVVCEASFVVKIASKTIAVLAQRRAGCTGVLSAVPDEHRRCTHGRAVRG